VKLTNLLRRSTGASGERPSRAAAPLERGLSLQDLVLMKVAVSWQEAVALCLEVLQGAASDAFPDPAGVSITSIGEMHRSPGRYLSGSAGHRAALFLRDLIGNSPMPEELRAVLDRNLAGTSTQSKNELIAALTYFERPNRRADIAAVQARAQSIYSRTATDQELERLRARVHSNQPPEPPVISISNRVRRMVGQGTLVLILCGVIAASGYVLLGLAFKPAAPTDDAGAPVEEPSLGTAIGTAGRQVTEQVKDIVATGIAIAEERLNRSPASVEPTVPAPPQRTATPSVRRTASVAEAVEFGPSPSWTVSVQDVTATWLAARGPAQDVDAAPGLDAGADPAVAQQPLGPLYSALDADVEPATLIRPQLPSEVRNLALPEGEVGTLELVVNERGSVDQVRLVSATSRLNEKMLIAAAKAWLFDPARRDGLPVRYVVRIQITE